MAGIQVSKANLYAVLTPPIGVSVTKAVVYAVLTPPNATSPNWGSWSFPNGTTTIAYSYTWDMPGAASPVTYTVQSGALPDGLSLSGSGTAGTISGTPTVAGTFNFTLRASNSAGAVDKAFSITITDIADILPSESDVRHGVTYGVAGANTGTAYIPSAGDVRSGVSVDATTGNLALPTAAQVLIGVGFGSSGTQYTGTVTLPAVSNVRSGITFGASLGLTGTVTLPAIGDVRNGVQFGASGTEFTGTLSAGGTAAYGFVF